MPLHASSWSIENSKLSQFITKLLPNSQTILISPLLFSFLEMSEIADFENMLSLENPIKSSVMSRWERKQLAAKQTTDRFIPNRSGMDKVLSQQSLSEDIYTSDESEASQYAKILTQSDPSVDSDTRILAFKNKAPAPKDGYQSSLKVLYSQNGAKKNDVVKTSRHISSAPVKILDAPDLVDDYYLNLLSWSANNILSVALSQSCYLWDASSGSIKELMTLDNSDAYISSVSWIQQGGNHIAIGTSENVVELWDAEAMKKLRTLRGHASRVGALAWNSHILTSGSRDTHILNHDVRIQQHVIGSMQQHSQEVCGLSWSPDGTQLASGANDNTCKIFDITTSMVQGATASHVFTEHQAAVKALAWSPHERNLLATGGGTADRCIKFWNTSSGSMINSVDTGSQVCSLQWSPHEKEILSSHGYAENQLCLWKYPSMVRCKELKGHTARVLHMATSPDGNMVCSAAADETLRFWNIFGSDTKKKTESSLSSNTLSKTSSSLKIR